MVVSNDEADERKFLSELRTRRFYYGDVNGISKH